MTRLSVRAVVSKQKHHILRPNPLIASPGVIAAAVLPIPRIEERADPTASSTASRRGRSELSRVCFQLVQPSVVGLAVTFAGPSVTVTPVIAGMER